MQAFIFTSLLALFSINVFAQSDSLFSEEIASKSCELLVEEHPVLEYMGDTHWSNWGVHISNRICDDMEKTVVDQKSQKIGSTSYIVTLNLEFTNDEVACALTAERGAEVTLDDNDRPTVQLSAWVVSIDDCSVKMDPRVAKFTLEEKQGLRVTKLEDSDLFIPEYLDLGEPDDSTYGTTYTIYALYSTRRLVGYYVDYWYANTEGEWSNNYHLRYSAKKILNGASITVDGGSFCDYPDLDKRDMETYDRYCH